MRTTLVIPDAVGRRAKQLAKHQKMTLSQLFTEAVEARLVRDENMTRGHSPPCRIHPRPMGRPAVDISDRNALYDTMDERS